MKTTTMTVFSFVSAVVLLLDTLCAASAALPLVALGSESNPHACVGILISLHHVLVHSTCATSSGPLTTAQVLEPPVEPSADDSTRVTFKSSVRVANSSAIPINQLPSDVSSSIESVHVAAFEDPLPCTISRPVTLPLKTPYPSYLSIDKNTTMVSIDMATLHVQSISGVTFIEGSSCNHPVCVLPLQVEDQGVIMEPNRWSFLLTRSSDGDSYRLLGVGGGPATNHDGIWGFEWLPQALTTSSLSSHQVHGLQTVVSVSKEIYGGKDVKTTSEYTEFIAGLRAFKNGTTLCTVALIAQTWVLTAAGCTTYDLRYVVIIDTLPTRGEPTEVLRIQQMIAHPAHSGHKYNFMLVQLDSPSRRRPVKYNQNKDHTPVSSMATAFGYGATSYHSHKLNDRLRSNKVEVLGAEYCPKIMKNRMNEATMCVKQKLCYGEFGGPVVTDAWSSDRVLYGIISNDFGCFDGSYYNVVGRVSRIADWIKTIMVMAQSGVRLTVSQIANSTTITK